MKKFMLILALLLGVSGVAFADSEGIKCPPGQALRKIGTVATTSGVVTNSGHDVALVVVTCTTTACRATLYDADDPASEAIDANVVLEAGTIASSGEAYYFPTPLNFTDGIYFHDDANVTSFQAYECVPE